VTKRQSHGRHPNPQCSSLLERHADWNLEDETAGDDNVLCECAVGVFVVVVTEDTTTDGVAQGELRGAAQLAAELYDGA
jgi:hypothetical protein